MLCKDCNKYPINTQRSKRCCTKCLNKHKQYMKKYYVKNRDTITNRSKEYYYKNKERVLSKTKLLRTTRVEKLLSLGMCITCGKQKIDTERSKKFCSVCLDRKNELQKEYWFKNADENRTNHRKANKKYYNSNKKKVKKYKKKYYENNKDKYLEYGNDYRGRKLNADGNFTEDEWKEVLHSFGNKCLKCGTTENIERDHVIPLSRGGSNFIDNIQPLCRSCNSSKGTKTIDFRQFGSGILEWT